MTRVQKILENESQFLKSIKYLEYKNRKIPIKRCEGIQKN